MQVDQDTVLEQLRSADAYPHETDDIRTVETHISWVFLTGRYAYKIKKAVKLSYLDFSTLEYRERACRDELALNQRLAPALYDEVVSIGGDTRSIRVGTTPAVEYAVKMTEFPDGAAADALIRQDALCAADFAGLAEQLARFHQSLAPLPGNPQGQRIIDNLAELESDASANQRRRIAKIGDWVRPAISRLSNFLSDRETAGRIRECHGDLHLGNIARIDDRLIAFDCLEFSLDLRTIDVIDEVAFLFMDLIAHRRTDLAYGFLNDYLEIAGDYDGMRLLRLYATHRALVRAKVETTGGSSRYLDTALALTRMPRPLCLITHGLSGSGKTTIARRVAAEAGAVHLRSDVERKRLYGVESAEHSNSDLNQGLYDPEASRATYRRLAELAEASLDENFNVIIDASFLDRRKRDSFQALASKLDAGFAVLSIEAPIETLRGRIVERNQQRSDASEADLAVLDHQMKTADALGEGEMDLVIPVPTEKDVDIDRLVEKIRTKCAQESLSSTST